MPITRERSLELTIPAVWLMADGWYMVVLRVRRVIATMYIHGFTETLARKAPAAPMATLNAISFLAPYLSERIPAGMEMRSWQKRGIAEMRPICWLVRLNSA
jgi:hypothetical protein